MFRVVWLICIEFEIAANASRYIGHTECCICPCVICVPTFSHNYSQFSFIFNKMYEYAQPALNIVSPWWEI